MSYLTYSYLENFKSDFQKAFDINEGFKKTANFRRKIFLSHRHQDKELVKRAVGFLNDLKSEVYIDWLDYKMPEITNYETACKIKKKILECDKFILLATENSLKSKWIPWELGIGDISKGIDKVAILPVTTYDKSWPEREYFQIYGTIKLSKYDYWCYYPPRSNDGTFLNEWL